MKKLLALIALVLLCSYSFAQNVATVNETGNSNSAVVTQTGQNTSTVTQLSLAGALAGTACDATVTQIGTLNQSVVLQDRIQSPDPRSEDVAVVSQNGNSNYSYLEQAGIYGGSNFAKVEQISTPQGVGNDAYQYQGGYGNRMEMYQNGDANYGYQFTGFTSDNNDFLSQVGNSNRAEQYANGGDDADITAIQNGNNNNSVQTQGGLKNNEFVNQVGNNNTATQNQLNGSYMFNGQYAKQHNASITQLGNSNSASQYQTENVAGAFDNSRNSSVILQQGNSNNSDVIQNEGLNIGNVTQVGNTNIGDISQFTLGNSGVISQTGDLNSGIISQSVTSGNNAAINQLGNSNAAQVIQH